MLDGGLLPAHLTGNMWAQTWSSLIPLVFHQLSMPMLVVDLTITIMTNDYSWYHMETRVLLMLPMR
jgi:hypothetical protein